MALGTATPKNAPTGTGNPLDALDIDAAFDAATKEIAGTAGGAEPTSPSKGEPKSRKNPQATPLPDLDDEDPDATELPDAEQVLEHDDGDDEGEPAAGDDDEPELDDEGEPKPKGKAKPEPKARTFRFTADENAVLSAARVDPDTISQLSQLPPNQRELHINMLRQQLQSGGKQDASGNANGQVIDTALLDKHMPIDDALVTTFAESLNVEGSKLKGVLQSVRNATAKPLLEAITQLKGFVDQVQSNQTAQVYGVVTKSLRPGLQRQYDALRDPAAFKKLATSKTTLGLVRSYMDEGLDISDAAEKALTERAATMYGKSAAAKEAAKRASARTSSLRGSSDPGASTRKPGDTVKAPKGLDDALDMAFDTLKEKGRL